MDRLDALKKISFDARVAEDETNELASYFVETDEWHRLFKGDVDIIKGDKGAGKSAIYALPMAKANELRGGPALRDRMAAWLRWILGSITPPISPRLPA